MGPPEGQLEDPEAVPALGGGPPRSRLAVVDSSTLTNALRVAERPQVLLAACVAIAVAVNLWVTRGQTFFSDEWGRLLLYGDSVDSILRGYSGHLVLVHALLYKAVLGLFGADTYLPFRLIEASLVGICGVLFYLLARASSGPWGSLAATVVVLFLGSAFEVTATPYGIVILLPMAFGLGALVCLRRFPGDGDLLACLLLVAAVASQSVGLAFVAGAGVVLAQQSGRRVYARAWVVFIPAVIYAAWYAWSRLTAPAAFEQPVHLSNLGQVPSTMVGVSAAGLSAASGLFGGSGFTGDGAFASFNLDAGYLLLGLLVVAAFWRVRRGPPLRREIWVPLALALTFWGLVGMATGPDRPPQSSRYLYPSAAFLLLFLLQGARGTQATPRVVLLACVAVAVSLIPNLLSLTTQAGRIRGFAPGERAELGALDLLRGEVPVTSLPAVTIEAGVLRVGRGWPPIASSRYFDAVDRYGSPALTPSQLALAGESQRQAADRVLLEAGDLAAVPAPSGRAPPSRGCGAAGGSSGGPASPVRVPPQGLVVRPLSHASRVTVAARRFAAAPQPLRLPSVPGPVLLASRAGPEGPPWLVFVSGGKVCRPR